MIDFKKVHEYDFLREKNWVGFAEVYLDRCNKESDADIEADISVYKKLVKLDERLGTTPSEQLFKCLHKTTRWDIIKVRIHFLNVDLNLFQSLDFNQVSEYKRLKKDSWVGFAEVYLDRGIEESKTGDAIDTEVYTKLSVLDTRLGTETSEQLLQCLRKTTRWDIIKV